MSPATAIPSQRIFLPEKVRRFAEACMPPLRSPENPPWRLLPHLLLLAFMLRAALALSGDFIVHPDENHYLESAHALVFGSGILPLEFHFGARSWLVPGAVAVILFLCKILGLGEPAYYIPAVKLTLCAFSLLIPLCMYHLGRRLFSETTARTALLFGVFWYELVGFAHKPMTEFIATALFLLLLTMMLRPRLTPTQAATASAFAVLVVAVRLQYAPLIGLVWLIPFWRGCARTRLLMLAAAIAAVCAVGLFDKLTWGEFLQPYWSIYILNIALDEYEYRLHEGTTGYYVLWLGIASGGLALAALAGVFASCQRAFLLLLMLAVLLPHEMQVHREYRYVFALVPLWLLLCADVLCNGWRSKRASTAGNWRRLGLLGWVMLASVAGTANALPWQNGIYQWRHHSSEKDQYLAHFLRNQDKTLPLCLRLGRDPSVRGVADIRRYYLSCYYYHFHRKAPLYTRRFSFSVGIDIKEYASHIIAFPLSTIRDVRKNRGEETILFAEDGLVFTLPVFVSDATLDKLVFWDKDGKSQVVEGFVLTESNAQFTLWEAEKPQPVRKWKSYRIYDNAPLRFKRIEKGMRKWGINKPPPALGHTFELANEDAPH